MNLKKNGLSELVLLVNIISFFYNHVQSLESQNPQNDPWVILENKLAQNLSPEDAAKAEFLLKKHFKRIQGNFDIPLVETFDDTYDFVIIGSGPGGSVMANRLSEVGDWKILLLEAGEQETPLTDVPLLSSILEGSTFDWKYEVQPQTRCCLKQEGKCSYPRGKALGGTSVINGMLYVRGNKRDYDTWNDLGNIGWSYDDILKYFKKSEDIRPEELQNSSYHSKGGYLTIEHSSFETFIDDVIINAGREMGYYENDNNGANQTGFIRPQEFLRDGSRCSASKAFLRPAAIRNNLSIATGAFVTKILIDSNTNKAHGVTFTKNNTDYTVKTIKEVILSAGSISSPQILMLSGVGPTKHLQDMEIEVIQDLPVGEILKDHIATPVLRFDMDHEFEVDIGVLRSTHHIENYFQNGIGPLTLPNGLTVLGSIRTKFADSDITFPDVEIFYRVANLYGDLDKTKKRDSLYAEAMLFHPKSTGNIKLNSKNPRDMPKINPNCFAEPLDEDVLVEALKLIVSISRTGAFEKYNTTLELETDPVCDPLGKESDEYWKCFLRNTRSADHQVSTCKMGPKDDPSSVVDPESLKPYGIEGLRIVDASVIPTPPTGHTTAVVYMIAEKAADLVKRDWKEL